MKKLLCMALAGAATATIAQTSATSPPTVTVRTAASSPVATGASENFTGTVRVSAPFQALPPGRASGGTVSFEARARSAWHIHPLGQTLIVTAGLGLVQQQGQPALVIRPGDVATIPANVRHWHGAGPDGPMTHVAIAEREAGNSVTWQDKVSDADYLAAVAGAGLAAGGAQGVRTPARVWPTSDTLSAQQRAIPLIAAPVATSDMPKLNAALNQGLDAGMTLSEAKEVLVQLYAYTGFPKSLNALGELMKVVQARQQRGIQDAPGREPGRTVATGEDLTAAGQANQTEISGGPVQGGAVDFAPVINQFLQAHLFGAIFERDNLDWQSRELATVGALAATPGVEAQLRSHMRASLRVGLTAAQLRQLTRLLAEQADAETAKQGYEYYWRTHAHPGSTFKYTTSSLLDLMRWDTTDEMALIEQPLLMIAGSKADSLYMTEDAFAKAIGAKDKELFKIEGATHIETYWVDKYVNATLGKLTPFFARTL